MSAPGDLLLETLRDAAARGVQVTIITNARDPVPLTLRWAYHETSCGAVAKFRGAGLDLVVMDCDGDRSWWELRRGKTLVAEGDDIGWEPYHFDACMLAAEAALRAAIRIRIVALRKAP